MNERVLQEVLDLLSQGASIKEPYTQLLDDFRSISGEGYMTGVEGWVPDYGLVHDLLIRCIEPRMVDQALVLDLGAGNGRLSGFLLERWDSCQVTLADVSDGFLEGAQDRLKAFQGRFTTVPGDMYDPAFDFDGRNFDCVVSSFSVCHGREVADYRVLYGKIEKWLKPAGRFVCLDHVYGATAELTAQGFSDWAKQLETSYGEERAAAIMKNAIWEDSPLTVHEHLNLLGEVGFAEADVLWKKNVFALYMGEKKTE